MPKQEIKTIFSNPFIQAIEAAGLFFLGYVFFAVGVIFLVQGDGRAPWITHAFLKIVQSVGGPLGYRPHEAPIYVVGLLFSFIVFFAVLLIKFLRNKSSD
jgi:hypothetical protein